MTTVPFALYDAFTDMAFGGSQAGVITDAADIDEDTRIKIAREIGAPATSFVSAYDQHSVTAQFYSTVMELPMCGHGTIGTVTVALERGLVTPREPGILRLDTPAGLVEARYTEKDGHVDSVRLTNIPSFVYATDLDVEVPDLGTLHMDVAYGGNFYAIVEPQDNYRDMAELSLNDIQILSPIIRQRMNDKYDFQHPEQPEIKGLSHVMWTGVPRDDTAHARNAVFYGDKAIDRSPCGTGTSARLAHLWTRGDLSQGEDFTHESIIGSLFKGRVEDTTMVGDLPAIIPSVEGWARITGDNTIYIDDRDPFAHGFMLA